MGNDIVNNNDFGFFVVGLILTAIFAFMSLFFWWKRKRLHDLRTLTLGRLTFLYLFCLLVALNGLLGSMLVLTDGGRSIWLFLLGIEVAVFMIFSMLLGLVIPLGIVILTVKMWRRETRTVANLLLPIVVLFFLVIDGIFLAMGNLPEHLQWLSVLSWVFPLLSLYLAWQFTVFFLSSWVYGRRTRKLEAAFHVVLGAGLIDGERVGILLGNRIKAAVQAVRDDQTIVVFSGGQGTDEKVSEASAMQKYAHEELGFPSERTLLEEKSRTTYENIVFSSELIKVRFLFFTSDYHVFRAALFAAALGLEAEGGRGGKTAMYYRVPAFIREFIAVLNTEKKKHMIWVATIIGLLFIITVIQLFLYYYVP